MSKRENPDFDVDTYHPHSLEEVEFVPSPLPSRDFTEGMVANYQPALFPNGLIVINIAHKDYPDAICQIQMFPGPETYDTFFFHGSPSEHYIPDDEAERISEEVIPITLQRLEDMFPKGPVQ